MQIGDNVRVQATGRRARIIEDHGHARYRILFYAEPAVDALDTATIEDEDDAGGIYDAQDLDVIPGLQPELSAEYQRVGHLTRWLALAGVVGPVIYVADFTIVGLLRPDYSAVSQAVSELGVGPDGWQLNLALIALGVLLPTFAVGFFQSLTVWSGKTRRWVSSGLLMLPGVGFAMAGIFPLPNPLHWLLGASLVFIGSIPAFFVTGFLLRRNLEWRALGTYAVVTGWLTLLLVIALFGVANPSSPAASVPVVGLVERALFVEMLAWYAVAGWRIFGTRTPA